MKEFITKAEAQEAAEDAGLSVVQLKRGMYLLKTSDGRFFDSAGEQITINTCGVLGGAYRGKDVEERGLLTHTEIPDTNDALCGRVKKHNLVDVYSDPEGAQDPPTCPYCLARDPRFKDMSPNGEEDDDTDRIISDARHAPGQLADTFRRAAPAGGKLTAAQERVLAKVNGLELPFISNVLLYARELQRMGSVEHRIVFSLIKGGRLRVLRKSGPLPGSHPASAIGAREHAHYQLAAPMQPNSGYYVWVLGRDNVTAIEGPYGPHDLQGAKTFARIAATEGVHDRAVSRGLDPAAQSFKIVRQYRAGTGERIV